MPRFTLLFATTNPGKLRELIALLKGIHIEVVSLDQVPLLSGVEIEETGATFIENASLKARHYGQLSGLVTLADDSGLSVDALNGEPGINSKRLGLNGEDRIRKLLAEMITVPEPERTAHFTTALALYNPASDKLITVEGRIDGLIATKPKGSQGYDFDPIFFSPELGKTFAEAGPDLKNTVSHRARAIQKIIKHIKKFAR